jgi:hypothetical protein
MQCQKKEDFTKLLKEKIFQYKLKLMPGVMQLVDYYIWVDISKANKKTYNLIIIMPRAQMSLNELLNKK